jgi:hypothetical protein
MTASPEPVVAGVLVSLDVLLDTRIATVAKLAGHAVALEVLKGNYHTRKDDKFPAVSVEAYKTLYAARDEETLALSCSTNIDTFLRDLVHSLLKQTFSRPFHQGVRVVINTYPYQLSDEITQQILGAVIDKLLPDPGLQTPLTVVAEHLPDQALTPDYCKNNFSALLMYDYEHWLQMQQLALLKRPMPEVTLFAPALYFVHTPTEEEIAQHQTEFEWDPFESIQRAVRGGIDLQFLPIELFSIVKPVS